MGFKTRPSRVTPPVPRGAVSAPKFSTFYERAVGRKGVEELEKLLPAKATLAKLRAVPDDRVLSAMANVAFCAGFVWKVVEAKWPGFEAAFEGFDPLRVATFDGDRIEELSQDTRIIRNRQKILSVRDNARFVLEVGDEHGSFGQWLATWPADDPVGLWRELKTRGSRLGGFTGPLLLRYVGFDTFMLSPDVVKALIGAGIVQKKPTSRRDLAAVQDAFNQWREDSGRPFSHISRIVACSVD